MLQVRLSQQGELVKIRPIFKRTEFGKKFGRGLRGQITKFSARSRKTMLERFAIIDKEKAGGATFITLTYVTNMRDEEQSFSHLRSFLKRLRYAAEIGSQGGDESRLVKGEKMFFCWKKEYQDRGAIHWHVMAFGLKWADKDWLAHTWAQITGETMPLWGSDGEKIEVPPFTRIEYCRSVRKAWYYMGKYMAKSVSEPDQAQEPNLERGFNIGSNLAKVGRYWGWENRKNIPYAEKEVTYVTCTWAEYQRFRWDLSNIFEYLRKTLLMDSVKMFWFWDFLSPREMFQAALDGARVSSVIQWDKVRMNS